MELQDHHTRKTVSSYELAIPGAESTIISPIHSGVFLLSSCERKGITKWQKITTFNQKFAISGSFDEKPSIMGSKVRKIDQALMYKSVVM